MIQATFSSRTVTRFKDLHIVGKFFVAIFLIVLFEGAVRKWVWSGATLPLLGMRDLIVVIAVLWGIMHRYFDFRAWPELFLFSWSMLIIFWTGIQLIIELQPPIVGMIGLRFWVLYLWFVLLCVRALKWQDIEYLFKFSALTLLFMVPLALVQFMSPPTAFINKQTGDEQYIFQVIRGVVRTTGTFSFTIGYTTYLSFVTPVVLWMMSGGLKDSMKPMLRTLIIGLFFVGVLVSGSRGAIMTTVFFVGMLFVFLLLANKLPRIFSVKMFLGLAGLIVLITLLFPILGRSFEANIERFETASRAEDLGGRILDIFIGSDRTWEKFDLLGHGIGAGANASAKFMGSGKFSLGEYEIDRTINEGGIIGLVQIVFKWLIVLIGLIQSRRIFIRYHEILPLLIWLVIAIQIPTGSIIGQLTVHGLMLLLLATGFTALSSWKNEKLRRQRGTA